MKFLYKGSVWFLPYFSRSLLILSALSLSQTPLNDSKSFPQSFLGLDLAFFIGMIFFSSSYHTFHAFFTYFWGLWKFLGFFKILEVFVKFFGWALLKWVSNHHTLHFMSILTILSCILDVCFICYFDCMLVGLDWAEPMMFFKFARHMLMHFHTYVPTFSYILIYSVLVLFCFSLSLSLSIFLR